MKGPLKAAFNTADIADIMAFDMFPWGQGMWNTPTCGEMDNSSYVWGSFWAGYDANARICFNVMCGSNANALYGPRPAECFDNSMGPFCQHGGAECAVNAIQACAKQQSNNSFMEYGPFVVCFEENYKAIQQPAGATFKNTFDENRTLAQKAIKATMGKCTKGSSLDSSKLLSCYENNEKEMLSDMAAATTPHVTVPFVRIMQCDRTWNVLDLGDGDPPSDILINAVCDAACDGGIAASSCSKLGNKTSLLIA